MHRLWPGVIEPLVRAVRPGVIVEIGAAAGQGTRQLLEFVAQAGGALHSIDPMPAFDVAELERQGAGVFTFHRELSLNALPQIESADVYFLDGDHNWYTAINELRLIGRAAADAGRPFPLVLLHDVGWPYGRRDLYYDPSTIPDGHRQPYRAMGLVPGRPEPTNDEPGLNSHLSNGLYENNVRNGVLTAVEDYVRETDAALYVDNVPGLHGLGVVVAEVLVAGSEPLQTQLRRLRSARFLRSHAAQLESLRVEASIASSAFEKQLEKRTSLLRELEQAEAEREAQLDEIERKRQAGKAELQSVQGELADARETVDELRASLAQALQVGNGLRAGLERLEATNAELSERQADLRGRLGAARDSGAGLRAKLEEAQQQVERLTADSRQLQETIVAQTRTAREEHRRTQTRVRQLAQAVRSGRALADELEESRRELEQARARAAAERTDVAGDRDKALRDLEDAWAHARQLDQQLAQAREDEAAERNNLAADRDQVLRDLENAWTHARQLDQQLAQAHDEGETAGQELARLNRELAERERSARESEAETQRIRAQLGVIRDDIERVATSRSWRFGHGVMSGLARLTRRRQNKDGGVERALDRIAALERLALAGPTDVPPAEERALTETPPAAPEQGASVPAGAAAVLADEKPEMFARRAQKRASTTAREALGESLTHTAHVLEVFGPQLGPLWVDGAADLNVRSRDWLRARSDEPRPRVMVGTLHSGENDFEPCRRSVARQSYPGLEHVVIEGLPKKQAVATLMERFLASDFDLMVKVDADVVLLESDFVERVVEIMHARPEIDLLQVAILDYFSGGPIQGINTYRRTVDWQTRRQDALFTDKSWVEKNQRFVIWAPFLRSAIHAPNPSAFEAFHFGVHRGLKALQPDAPTRRPDQAEEQMVYLERTWDHFQLRKDVRLGLACLGFELGSTGAFAIGDLDYTDPSMREAFEQYEALDAAQVEQLVRARRVEAGPKPVRELRAGRRELVALSTAPIASLVMPVPHLGLYGGVNRFLELAQRFRALGIEAVVAYPDGLLATKNRFPSRRPDYPKALLMDYEEALGRAWDVVLCGDASSGVMLTLPCFQARLTAVYLINGWMRREANIQQARLVEPDVVVANSSYAASWYPDLAPVVVPGGVDLEHFTSEAAFRPCTDRDRFRVVAYAGRMKSIKGFETILDACRLLHETGLPVELNVFNDGELTIEAPFPLRLHGRLGRDQLRTLLAGCDLFLSGERDAGWSNPTAEAMACGTPVVCTEAGTVDFAIDGETALVVPVGDDGAMAAAARRVWEEPELAMRLRTAGLDRIAQFGWASVTQQLLDVLSDARFDAGRRMTLNARARKRIERITALDRAGV